MNRRDDVARRVLRWYPVAWRESYGNELVDLLLETYPQRRLPARAWLAIARAGTNEYCRATGLRGARPRARRDEPEALDGVRETGGGRARPRGVRRRRLVSRGRGAIGQKLLAVLSRERCERDSSAGAPGFLRDTDCGCHHERHRGDGASPDVVAEKRWSLAVPVGGTGVVRDCGRLSRSGDHHARTSCASS